MHAIRLREPWDAAPLPDSPGVVRFTRHFNKPTGLDGGERVWLVLEEAAGSVSVALNGNSVGQASRLPASSANLCRFDLTALLELRNKLEIDVTSPPDKDAASSLGQVRLEIE